VVSFINKRQSASPLPSSAGYESQKSVPVFIFSHFSRLARPVSEQQKKKKRTIIRPIDGQRTDGWTNRCKCLLIQPETAYSGFCVFLERVGRNRDKSTWPQFNGSRGQACALRLRHTDRTCSRLLYLPSRCRGGKGGKVS
jgi:hypothetical protein